MQDVTNLAFINLLGRYGPPDLIFTEYFRVHVNSTLDKEIVNCIRNHNTKKPIFAQLIGESLFDLERTIKNIYSEKLPVTGIDLNMGCPAPKIYKKNVGGGLLRDPRKIEQIFKCLREAIPDFFTVKMRIGFECDKHFYEIMDLINKYNVSMLSLHARAVKGGYKSVVQYEYIKEAAKLVNCPVLANGNITSYTSALKVLKYSKCKGVMIGRACIRNPWIFKQIKQELSNEEIFRPKFEDVRIYIEDLYEMTEGSSMQDLNRINYLKKFLNFIGTSIDNEGNFLYQIRRCKSKNELDEIADNYLIKNNNSNKIYPLEPIDGLVARPNCEASSKCHL